MLSFSNIIKPLKEAIEDKTYGRIYLPFVWHGFFLALTMAMIEMNTVLPSLISELTKSTVAFGALYSIMLGAPLVFNLLFSRYLERFVLKKKFLLLGIYLRSFSFLGMSVVTLLFAKDNPFAALIGFYFLIFIFSISGGFAGIAYSDIIGKLLPSQKRGELYAVRQLISGVASLLGGFFVAWVFKPGSLQFPFNYALNLFIGFIGLILGAMGFWMIKEPPSTAEKKENGKDEGFIRDVISILKKDRRFLRFIIVENVTSFSLMILPFYLVFVKSSFPGYEAYLGAFVISQIIGSMSSNFLWAFISNKFGAKRVVKVCIFMGALIPIIAIILRPLGPVWYMIVFLLVGFITSGRNIGFEPYLLDIAPDDKRTIYLGIRGTLNIFDVFLPIAGGLFINWLGYYASFGIVSLVMFSTFLALKPEKER